MIKIKIASIGKNKEKWLDQAMEDYLKRLKPMALIEFVWLKEDQQLVQFVSKEPLSVCLDISGTLMSSEEFSAFLRSSIIQGGSRIGFVIGGPEGLPAELRNHPYRISLSRLTMTHQIARLVLIEQIYRAFEIEKGSPYHK